MTTLYTAGVWAAAVALESTILYRGVSQRLFSKFPWFYSYICAVLVSELTRFIAYNLHSDIYPQVYWSTQWMALLFGAALMFEIYKCGLTSHPGTARIARNILFLVFALLLAKSIALASPGGVWTWLTEAPIELERDLRLVQVLALMALGGLFSLYWVPVDRNLRGILFGYGLFVASSVIQLTLVSRWGPAAQTIWYVSQTLSYILVLSIWLEALWALRPLQTRIASIEPPPDYEVVSAATRGRFREAQAELVKGVRP